MSIGLRAVGLGTLLAVVGALLLGWRHQRAHGPAATARADAGVEAVAGVEEGI
jgi:hypothetical protein